MDEVLHRYIIHACVLVKLISYGVQRWTVLLDLQQQTYLSDLQYDILFPISLIYAERVTLLWAIVFAQEITRPLQNTRTCRR